MTSPTMMLPFGVPIGRRPALGVWGTDNWAMTRTTRAMQDRTSWSWYVAHLPHGCLGPSRMADPRANPQNSTLTTSCRLI